MASFRFSDIAKLTDREIQRYLREVDSKDLAAAMKRAGRTVQDSIFRNVSGRVKALLTDEIAAADGSRTAAMREKSVAIVQGLIEKGRIVWPADKPPPKRKLSKRYLREKEKTLAGNLADKTDLDTWIVGVANIARAEGILELAKIDADGMDRVTEKALRLVIDGVEPNRARGVLEDLAESCLREQEVRYRKVIEGLMAVQAGDNPKMIGEQVGAIF